ncbi:MAG: large subunit ribosomal protein L18 [Parcubacteria group bacterium Gr01-1014_30]|nr:MAG: large subunit ribosomal protein L18 [Parcubacteria group bacterium Gr01-1014_30]
MIRKKEKRYRRHRRIRAKIFGTKEVPRLCIFRSSKHIYAQLIDDMTGRILLSASEKELKSKKRQIKVAGAKQVGILIAKKALEKKVERAVFDRGGYKYHGRVRALAEGAREGGLKF